MKTCDQHGLPLTIPVGKGRPPICQKCQDAIQKHLKTITGA